MHEISQTLPELPTVFISSITGLGIPVLKDILWQELNRDAVVPLTASHKTLLHRNLDVSAIAFQDDETLPEEESSVDEEEGWYDEDDLSEQDD